MKQFVSRRRRCWTLLTQMDPVILSEGHRSDRLLDLSGLTLEERAMVQASISNERDFDRVAEALIIQDPRLHLRLSRRTREGKRQRRNQTWRHTGSGKSGACAYYANFTSVEDYDYYYDEDMDESANAYQAHNDPVDPGSDDGEEALDYENDEEHDTFSSYVALDDVAVFEAAEFDAIALLAGTWNDDLDPEVSVQLVQASAQAYLSFGKGKGTGKGKAEKKGKGRYLVRPSHLSLEVRRQLLKELNAKTECHTDGRRGHWAHDREGAMSPSSLSPKPQTRTARMTTQPHSSRQAEKVATCFILNDLQR